MIANRTIPVTVVCGHIPKDIFEAIPGVEKVVAIKKKRYSLHWLVAAYNIGPHFWHRIVDFRSSLLGIFPARHHAMWKGGNDHIHKAVANAKLIGVDHPIPPLIKPTEAQSRWAEELLGLAQDTRPILALAPTANFHLKQWHYENYLGLAKALTAEDGILPGARIAIFGAPGEEAQALPVVEGLPEDQVINLVGKTSPMEAASILSKANLFVGNDSGLMHTAVAVQIPTVGLFGIGKPLVYGPWGDNSLCIKGSPAEEPIHLAPQEGHNVLPLNRVIREIEEFMGSIG
ncbi:MAG: glycosyltransferase family 9 protein [Sneathiella sp.]